MTLPLAPVPFSPTSNNNSTGSTSTNPQGSTPSFPQQNSYGESTISSAADTSQQPFNSTDTQLLLGVIQPQPPNSSRYCSFPVPIKKYSDGTIYQGDTKDGNAHGKGALIYPAGHESKRNRYVGEFKRDHPNGEGKIVWVDETTYEGAVVNGELNGKGVLIYASKHPSGREKYEGEFEKDHPDGKGNIIWNDGKTYVGAVVKDNAHGKGVLVYPSGHASGREKYKGDFKEGHPDGEGTITWKDGKTYVGAVVNGEPSGYGKLTSTEETYEGMFLNGKRHGRGTCTTSNGSVCVGEHVDDRKNGQWTYTDSQRNVCVGTFKDGDLLDENSNDRSPKASRKSKNSCVIS